MAAENLRSWAYTREERIFPICSIFEKVSAPLRELKGNGEFWRRLISNAGVNR